MGARSGGAGETCMYSGDVFACLCANACGLGKRACLPADVWTVGCSG
jgi:hypothetical protein